MPAIEQQRFYFNKFNQLVPPEINAAYKHSQTDFARHRKLPFRQFFAVILATVASGKNMGIDTKVSIFLKNARHAGLWPQASAIHRSSLTKSWRKVSWQCFEAVFHECVKLADKLWPPQPQDLWRGICCCLIAAIPVMRLFGI